MVVRTRESAGRDTNEELSSFGCEVLLRDIVQRKAEFQERLCDTACVVFCRLHQRSRSLVERSLVGGEASIPGR